MSIISVIKSFAGKLKEKESIFFLTTYVIFILISLVFFRKYIPLSDYEISFVSSLNLGNNPIDTILFLRRLSYISLFSAVFIFSILMFKTFSNSLLMLLTSLFITSLFLLSQPYTFYFHNLHFLFLLFTVLLYLLFTYKNNEKVLLITTIFTIVGLIIFYYYSYLFIPILLSLFLEIYKKFGVKSNKGKIFISILLLSLVYSAYSLVVHYSDIISFKLLVSEEYAIFFVVTLFLSLFGLYLIIKEKEKSKLYLISVLIGSFLFSTVPIKIYLFFLTTTYLILESIYSFIQTKRFDYFIFILVCFLISFQIPFKYYIGSNLMEDPGRFFIIEKTLYLCNSNYTKLYTNFYETKIFLKFCDIVENVTNATMILLEIDSINDYQSYLSYILSGFKLIYFSGNPPAILNIPAKYFLLVR